MITSFNQPHIVLEEIALWGVLAKGLDPDWQYWVMGLRLAMPKWLTREPVHVKLPVVIHDLHFAGLLTQIIDTWRAVFIMSSFVSPQHIKWFITVTSSKLMKTKKVGIVSSGDTHSRQYSQSNDRGPDRGIVVPIPYRHTIPAPTLDFCLIAISQENCCPIPQWSRACTWTWSFHCTATTSAIARHWG